MITVVPLWLLRMRAIQCWTHSHWLCPASPPEEADENSILHIGSSPVEGTRFTTIRVPYREGVFSQGVVHRRIPEGLGGSVQGCSTERGLDTSTMQAPYQPPGAICGPPFESVDIKFISYKTALLLALTSAKPVGNLQTLSVHPSCTQFTLDGSNVTLCPNAAYLPKIIPTAYSSMTFELLSYKVRVHIQPGAWRPHVPC